MVGQIEENPRRKLKLMSVNVFESFIHIYFLDQGVLLIILKKRALNLFLKSVMTFAL